MTIRFRSLIAPVEHLTGDGRMFATEGGTHRVPPIPWMAKFTTGAGHTGAVVVAKVEKITKQGDGSKPDDGWWAEGHYLDPKMVPEVAQAAYLAKEGVHNPSVDLDGNMTVQVMPHPTIPGKQMGRYTQYNVVGVTQLPIAAFSQTRIFCNDDEEKALLASAGLIDLDDEWLVFSVNAESWKSFPVATRDTPFDADGAVQRIAAWAGIGSRTPDVGKYASAFLWRDGNQTGDSLAQDSFRLPIIDIINGTAHLIYHAVYAAAALISGAHGGLPNVPDVDKKHLVGIIQAIYQKFRVAFNDPGMPNPFGAGDPNRGNQPAQGAAMDVDEIQELAPTKMPYGDVTYADPGYQADGKKRYPIDTPDHCKAAWAYINQADNAGMYTAEQLASIKARIVTAGKKYGIDFQDASGAVDTTKPAQPKQMPGQTPSSGYSLEDADDWSPSEELPTLLASVAPVAPPRQWFEDPHLAGPTPLTIDDDGRIFGHLAEWRTCHIGIGDKCVIAPRTKTNYAAFRLGPVICDDGSMVKIGKITLGTGHAHPQWGIVPSRNHYDNSGWAAAVVNVGEDQFGIWVSGALTSTMTPEKVAELRRSPLSGDWRRVNGNLELVAALAVNNPGFPVMHVNNGNDFSLVAAGVVEFAEETPPSGVDGNGEYDDKALRYLEIMDRAEEYAREKRMARFAVITDQAPLPTDTSGLDAQALAAQLDAFFTILENANNEPDTADPGHLPAAPAVPSAAMPAPGTAVAQPGAAPAASTQMAPAQ